MGVTPSPVGLGVKVEAREGRLGHREHDLPDACQAHLDRPIFVEGRDDRCKLKNAVQKTSFNGPLSYCAMELVASLEEIPPDGLRITYREGPFEEEAILLKLPDGGVRAYKNECRHLPVRLDERDPRELWDSRRTHLVCSSHGARYRPSDGLCVAGPCRGSHLRQLPLVVDGTDVFLDSSKLGTFFDV